MEFPLLFSADYLGVCTLQLALIIEELLNVQVERANGDGKTAAGRLTVGPSPAKSVHVSV